MLKWLNISDNQYLDIVWIEKVYGYETFLSKYTNRPSSPVQGLLTVHIEGVIAVRSYGVDAWSVQSMCQGILTASVHCSIGKLVKVDLKDSQST